jgi:hypothetical protein
MELLGRTPEHEAGSSRQVVLLPLLHQTFYKLAVLCADCASCCLELLGRTPEQEAGSRQVVLLPLVHQTWLPLKLVFKSANIFLVDKVQKKDVQSF